MTTSINSNSKIPANYVVISKIKDVIYSLYSKEIIYSETNISFPNDTTKHRLEISFITGTFLSIDISTSGHEENEGKD